MIMSQTIRQDEPDFVCLAGAAGSVLPGGRVDAVIDPRLPVSQGVRTSDNVKSMVGLLSQGKSDFEAINPFRGDRFFKEALGLSKVPGSV